MGLNEFWGTFPGATGTLTIDPKDVASAKLDVTIPVVGVETTNRELNGEFFSDEFFDAEKFPKMHFVSTGVTRTGERTAKLAGNLTLHGTTRPVVLDVTFNGAGPNAHGWLSPSAASSARSNSCQFARASRSRPASSYFFARRSISLRVSACSGPSWDLVWANCFSYASKT